MATFVINQPLSATAAESNIEKLDLSDAPHDFTFRNFEQVLYVENGEASASVILTITGMNIAAFECPGFGSVDPTGGYMMTVPAGMTDGLNLSRIYRYLGDDGNTVNVTVTGATTGNSFGYIVQGR